MYVKINLTERIQTFVILSIHPFRVRGKMSKCLGGNTGCKDKKSSWHSIRFPDGRSIGSIVV